MALNMKKLAMPLLAASLVLPSANVFAAADPFESDKPSTLAMYTDLLLLRPIGIVETGLGAVAYVLSLPFTLPVGGASEAGSVLVVEPAMYTFARCLGCTKTGRKNGSSAPEDNAELPTEAPAVETK